MSGIYDEPELYELACAYRDVPAEVAALRSWFGRHWRGAGVGAGADGDVRVGDARVGDGSARDGSSSAGDGSSASASASASVGGSGASTGVGSVLELAAGPAEHAREFASRGLRATALDQSAAMCRYAAKRARETGVECDVVEADMRDFSLGRHFDAAIAMLNSLCHLFTLDDMVAHLRAVAAHLVPGGLYVVELSHPADHFGPAPKTSSEWVVDVGGVRADVRWGGDGDQINPLTQVTDEHMTIVARGPGETVRTAADVVPSRFWTLTEMTAAIRLAGGFEVAATYGDFDDTTALDAPSAWRMVLVLRRG